MGKFLDHSGLSYLVSQLKAAIAKKADANIALYKTPQEPCNFGNANRN